MEYPKFYEIKIYLESKKHNVRHLLSQYSLPPMLTEEEFEVCAFGNTIQILFHNKEDE